MAPRPFLVSGGSRGPDRAMAGVEPRGSGNALLGQSNRVAMSDRPAHSPTEESNEQIYQFFEHFLKH